MSDPSRMRTPPLQCLYNEQIGLFVLAPAQNNIFSLASLRAAVHLRRRTASALKGTMYLIHELAAQSEALTIRCTCALGTMERPSAHKALDGSDTALYEPCSRPRSMRRRKHLSTRASHQRLCCISQQQRMRTRDQVPGKLRQLQLRDPSTRLLLCGQQTQQAQQQYKHMDTWSERKRA
jgi:hypothetical protein